MPIKFSKTAISYFQDYYKEYHCPELDELYVSAVSDDSNIESFSIAGNCIFCDERCIKDYKLTKMECYACIAHEIGHYRTPHKENSDNQDLREIEADKYVVELGLSSYLISALIKMCPDEELTHKRIERMSKTVTKKDAFKNLAANYSLPETTTQQKEKIVSMMRSILKDRNNGSQMYKIQNPSIEECIDINTCNYTDLQIINADMNHYQK